VLSGSKTLAQLNSKLRGVGLRPITHDHMSSVRLPGAGLTRTTLLFLGYKYDGDATTRDPFKAALLLPGGQLVPLAGRFGRPFMSFGSELVCMWNLPADQTNFAGCELRLSRPEDGANIAIISLK